MKLYHYTSLAALKNIIEKHGFWLTDLHYSNDPNEFSLTYEEFTNYIKKTGLEYPFKQYLFSESSIPLFYGIGFTCAQDSLSHWERYADNKKGVCIEIDSVKMLKTFGHCKPANLILENTLNSEQQKTKYIKKMVNESIERLKNYHFKYNMMYHVFEALEIIDLFTLSKIKFKANSYRDEQEYRLMFVDDDNDRVLKNLVLPLAITQEAKNEILNLLKPKEDFTYKYKLTKEDKKFYISSLGLNSYYELTFGDSAHSLNKFINRIILGPMCLQNISALRDFLDFYGLTSVLIEKSNIQVSR